MSPYYEKCRKLAETAERLVQDTYDKGAKLNDWFEEGGELIVEVVGNETITTKHGGDYHEPPRYEKETLLIAYLVKFREGKFPYLAYVEDDRGNQWGDPRKIEAEKQRAIDDATDWSRQELRYLCTGHWN